MNNKIIKSKDLARLLGLSPSTISMVINNKPGISEATRRLVLDKIAELNDRASEAPVQSQSGQFIYFMIYKKHGLVVGDTPFFSQLIEGIESAAKSHGMNLQITYYNEGSDLLHSLPLLFTKDCKGILLLATEMAYADALAVYRLGRPIVMLDSYLDELPADTVVINNSQAARSAVRYLVEMGHTTIGYLHSSIEMNNFAERRNGYYLELRRQNVQVRSDLEYRLTPTVEDAYREMRELLAQGIAMPTAFYADNDIIALSAMRALKEYGYRVPQDISIIGVDDVPMCELTDPPLTTMRVPKHQMGSSAVNMLIDRIHETHADISTIQIRTTLIERSSVARL